MLCSEFRQRLQSRLDQRQSLEDEHLESHAATCTQCDDLVQTWNQLEIRLRFGEIPELDPGFAAEVVRAVNAPVTRREPRRGRFWTVAVSVVASAACLLVLMRSAGPPPSRLPATSSELSVASPLGTAIQPGRMPTSGETPSADVSPEQYRQLIQDLLARLSEAHLEELETVDELAGSIRPLAATLNAALSALRRSLPVG